MKTNYKILKILIPCVLVVITTIILLLTHLLPKRPETLLSVSADDIVLEIDEQQKLNYNVSIAYAVISFEIENENIVTANGFTIKGVSIGSTYITIFAKHHSKSAECKFKVSVIETSNDNNDETPTQPETPEENPDNTPDNNPNPDQDYISFQLINQSGCTINNNTITVKANTNCFFRISFDEDMSEEYTLSASENISISKLEIGLNTWKINASQSGNIKIMQNNRIIGEIIVETN